MVVVVPGALGARKPLGLLAQSHTLLPSPSDNHWVLLQTTPKRITDLPVFTGSFIY